MSLRRGECPLTHDADTPHGGHYSESHMYHMSLTRASSVTEAGQKQCDDFEFEPILISVKMFS